MVYRTSSTQAPVHIVRFVGTIEWPISLISLTQTGTALRFTTAVVIRNDIIASIDRVATGANPSDR